jgi:hypothetical protein
MLTTGLHLHRSQMPRAEATSTAPVKAKLVADQYLVIV